MPWSIIGVQEGRGPRGPVQLPFLPPRAPATYLTSAGQGSREARKAEADTGQSSPLWEAGPGPHRGLGAAAGGVCAGEMTPRVWAAWLPSAVFLLQAPGCLALSGPRYVKGTVGGSLSVQCRYEEEFRRNEKYWCASPCSSLRRNKIVETTGSEREVRRGRVSIRDHPANLTFTVTMERLTEADGGTYRCGIDLSWRQGFVDDTFEVVVTVSPGEPYAPPLVTGPGCLTCTWSPCRSAQTATQLEEWEARGGSGVATQGLTSASPSAPTTTQKVFASTLGPPSSLLDTTLLSTTWPETPEPRQHPRSLLSSVHFLLLLFLKLPLFLSMLGAVLWVSRPQRGSGRGGPPRSENQ
ncbi:CMRF35-like molecule 6 [Phyllostomus discolor]|uniref:CMRF35-like molecule 6 n=1 Tax=Phyllostomus discolor TaxID=89673 RepID=A0A7E6CFK3_9CHIR|nr:CMRF35-like molecule 6 [Phyllostomus discolor]